MVQHYSPNDGHLRTDVPATNKSWQLQDFENTVNRSKSTRDGAVGAAQVDVIALPPQSQSGAVTSGRSASIESTGKQGERELLVGAAGGASRSSRKDSGWFSPGLDADDVPPRKANEDLVDDFLKSRCERNAFQLDTKPNADAGVLDDPYGEQLPQQRHSVSSLPVAQKHFEPKPLLERRSFSAMLLVGVKKKILKREPLALSDTQDVSLSWLFGGFTRDSWLRRHCYSLYTNDGWRLWNLSLIILNCAAVAMLPGLDDSPSTTGGWSERDWWHLLDALCLFFLGVEIAVGVVALGFASSNTSWFHCVEYHRLELAVFVLAIVENLLTLLGIRTLSVVPFRLLRVFHVLTVAKPLAGVRVMLQTLLQGSTQLTTVFATFVAITATFAIVGMAMFQRSFRRRCVLQSQTLASQVNSSVNLWGGLPDSGGVVITGGYPFYRGCKIVYNSSAGAFDGDFPLDPSGRYHTCQATILLKALGSDRRLIEADDSVDLARCAWQLDAFTSGDAVTQQCDDVGNPEVSFGFGSFDHLGTAMLVLFQSSLPDSFYDVFHLSLQTEPATAWLTWLYFFVITGISTCLMLGLFVAVVTGTFKRVREQSQYRDQQLKTLKLPKTIRPQRVLPLDDSKSLESRVSSTASAQRDLSSWTASSPVVEDGPALAGVHSSAARGADASHFATMQREPSVDLFAEFGDDAWKQLVSRWTAGTLSVAALNAFVNSIVVCHCVTLASDQYDSTPEWKRAAEWVYVACSVVYALEVTLHAAAVTALQRGKAYTSPRIWFKGVLCVLGAVGWGAHVEVLKRTQALWMYKLMRLLSTLQLLVSLTVASLEHVLSVCLFVCIWAIVYAITGRYVFGADMDALTRSNFGTMQRALLTVFQLFTGDSWSSVMYSALEAMPDILGCLVAALFILSWVLLSQFLLNNLFIAVIIDKFKVSEVISEQLRINEQHSLLARTRSHARRFWANLYPRSNWKNPALSIRDGMSNPPPEVIDLARSFSGPRSGRVEDDSAVVQLPFSESQNGMKSRARHAMLTSNQSSSVAIFNHLIEYNTTGQMMSAVEKVNESHHADKHEPVPDRVLFLFRVDHPVRRFCIWVGQTRLFDGVIIVAIVCSCLLLAITPRNDDIPGWDHVLSPSANHSWSLGFTVLFTFEFVVRVMHHGLLFTPSAYLKSGWNQADLLILIFAWVDETGVLPTNGISKIFRLGRAFRPLRLMKRNKGMRVLVDALIHALVPVSYVFVFSIFTSTVFGLVGMGLFGGRFYSCSVPGAEYPAGKRECVGLDLDRASGLLRPRSWINEDHNFDTIWDAGTTLLQVATLKYVRILYTAMDVTAVGTSPLEDSAESSAVFFVAFILCGRLFVYNLFVAFIVDGFYASRGSSQRSIAFGRLMRQLKIHKPPREDYKPWSNALSVRLRGVVQHRYFQTWSLCCVLANVLLMLTDHADPSPAFEALMWWQNLLFFAELCVEVLMQIIAYGPPAFVQDKWRRFDLAVALGTATGYISSHRQLAHFAKSFRLARALRFMTLIAPVRIIFETLVACLPQLFNIFLLVVLVYAIFAAVAVQLFGVTKYGRRLGPTANFATWPQAMQTCYQMLTGDEWMDLRTDCEVQYPHCTPMFDAEHVHGWEGDALSFGDCGVRTAYVYFIAFKVFCEAVLLNLVVGMALDNFTFVTDDVSHEEDATWTNGASSDQVRQLAAVFRQYDKGTGSIPLSFVPSLVHHLPRPLGFKETVLSAGRQSPRNHHPPPTSAPNSARSEQRERLLSPQVSEDRWVLKRIRAELNCLIRDRRLAGEGEHTLLDRWAKEGLASRCVQWVLRCVGFKRRFKEAVSFEEVMRTLVMWRLPELVPDEVHQWRQRWVTDDVMDMLRVLAVRDWLLLRARYKRKVREAREKMEQDAKSDGGSQRLQDGEGGRGGEGALHVLKQKREEGAMAVSAIERT